ncbi:MAG: shikimate dehydrogenase [Elusimicrobiales bacterium]
MQKPPLKTGLIGRPLDKSLSPDIFGVFAALTGERIAYELREVEPQGLRPAIEQARAQGWAGFNVTLPYKKEVCSLLQLADPAAKAAGAVNAVRFGRGGLEGMNTDARALLEAMQELSYNAAEKSAVVFGAGGAAASSGWALGRAMAASVVFRARDNAAALALTARLADCFPRTAFSVAPWEAEKGRPDILVNATPLGMYKPGRPPCEPAAGQLCVDLAYAPAGTEFLNEAARAGAIVADGLSLLVWQAALSLRFWAGLPTGDIVKFKREAFSLLEKKLKGGY